MSHKVYVVGVGMTKFMKPSDTNPDYPEMAKVAANRALLDSRLNYKQVQAVAVGYVYGDSTCGQRAVYEVGMTGVPIYNVNNNCATGSTALHLAKKFIEGGVYDCVMALGFEKMERGSLSMKYPDRTNPLDKTFIRSGELVKVEGNSPFAARLFGNAGIEHMNLFGTKPQHFAKIAAKNHKHSLNNPYSQFQKGFTLQEVTKAPIIHGILTKLQCCPTSDGAGCAILCNQKFIIKHGLQDQAVQIVAMELTTDVPKMYENNRQLVGYSMTKIAAQRVYQTSGVKPQEIGVVQLHDCFSANQLVTYEGLQLCPEGKAGQFIDSGNNTYGGKVVVNPSGGLTSKGHPLGATGLAQCSELCWQLRGIAGKRQVPNLKYALQHNLGLGGACVVSLYKKYNQNKSPGTSELVDIERLEKIILTPIQAKL